MPKGAQSSMILAFVPALVLGLVGLVLIGHKTLAETEGSTSLIKRFDGQLAVVFDPWMPLPETYARVAAAGALPVRQGRWSNILIVSPVSPDFYDRVRRQGAWLVLSPGIAGGCLAGS